jgi:hypothetical protein
MRCADPANEFVSTVTNNCGSRQQNWKQEDEVDIPRLLLRPRKQEEKRPTVGRWVNDPDRDVGSRNPHISQLLNSQSFAKV